MRRLALLLLALTLPAIARAQNDCDLGQVTDTTPLIYPPIARAAHVYGTIILRVSFQTTGEPDHIEVVSGPKMLQESATEYVKGWKAGPYTGPRTCPIIITYLFDGSVSQYQVKVVKHISVQHVEIRTYPPVPLIGEDSTSGRWASFKYHLWRLFHPKSATL